MAKKPSERRNFQESAVDLDLTSMMNLIGILIPVLLTSTQFVELAVLDVAAPAIGTPSGAAAQPPPTDHPPLNLTVTITDRGLAVTGSPGMVPNPPTTPGAPNLPIVQRPTSCTKYAGTWPPPRSRNRSSPRCPEGLIAGETTQTFWIYNMEALTEMVAKIKDEYPNERRIIIAAEPDIEFEAITEVMDATRLTKDADGAQRLLFDEVVISPGAS